MRKVILGKYLSPGSARVYRASVIGRDVCFPRSCESVPHPASALQLRGGDKVFAQEKQHYGVEPWGLLVEFRFPGTWSLE